MLAANTIRQVAEEENLSCKIGFFLHIPFPSYDIVKVFPWEDIIIQVVYTGVGRPDESVKKSPEKISCQN
jgi:trehalose-6-phosphate synthase